MKIKKISVLAFVLILLLTSACGETIPPPQPTAIESPAPAVDTPAAAPPTVEEPEAPAAEEANPTATTQKVPAATQTVPPALTDTPAIAPTLPPTPVGTAAPTLVPALTFTPENPPTGSGVTPQEGTWGGGGTSLIVTFEIKKSGDQMQVSDLRLVWFGLGDCEVNHHIPEPSMIDGDTFTRYYNIDDIRYTLTGKFISPTVVQGNFDLSYKDCGTPSITWRAVPK